MLHNPVVEDLSHSEHCFEWDRCDDCYDNLIQNHPVVITAEDIDDTDKGKKKKYTFSRIEIEPVINEQYDRPIIYTGSGYNIADRKSSDILDMNDNLVDLDVYKVLKYQDICKVCNLLYYTRLGYCPNC